MTVFVICTSCAQESTKLTSLNKINGVSFVASNNHVNTATIQPVLNVNANWVALMPFAFMRANNSPSLSYNSQNQWWGERIEGIKETASVFNKHGIKRMLKPQIWIRAGKFTGTIKMTNETDWLLFEKKYETFILNYAKVAESEKIELFCIGTELNSFIQNRPQFWTGLIQKIKTVYTGKLTYASNWDSYQNPNFWKDLDYIGIDAYFPLVNSKTPAVAELNQTWAPHKTAIKKYSIEQQKSIIFTEFGYRSVDFSTHKPWDSSREGNFNSIAQINALQSLFSTFWNASWFEGGFLWKWFDNHASAGGNTSTGYTVQNKDSEELIKKVYEN